MIINYEKEWAYQGINKNASTTLHSYLIHEPFNGVNPFPENQNGLTLEIGQVNDVFTVVRNPFTRTLSLWRHYLNEFPCSGTSFAQFVDLMIAGKLSLFYTATQNSHVITYNDWRMPQVKFIKLEELEPRLRAFFKLPSIPPIPRLNRTEWSTDEYDPVTWIKVVNHCWDDFVRFGYTPSDGLRHD